MLYQLATWCWRWTRRKMGLYGLASVSLLYSGLFAVVLSLSEIVRGLDDEQGWLSGIVLLVIWLGWWLGNKKRKAWIVWTWALISGVFLVLFHAGNLWLSAFSVMRAFLFYIWSLLDWRLYISPGYNALILSWREFAGLFSLVGMPLSDWFRGVLTGDVRYDRGVTIILWSCVLIIFAFWAGWAHRRYNRPLLSLLPAGVLLSGSYSYVQQDTYIALAGFAGIVLILTGINQQYFQEKKWHKTKVDFAEDLRMDALFSAGAVSTVAVVIAMMIPIINLRQIINVFKTPPAESETEQNTEVGESLGLRLPEPQVSPYQRVAEGGLPRLHLLGTGPELSEQIVMSVGVEDPSPGLPPQYYWRSLTYDTYTGRGWITGETTSISYREGVNALSPDDSGRVVRQQVRLQENVGNFIFSAGEILTLDWSYSIAWRTAPDEEKHLDQFAGQVKQKNYQVDALVPVISVSQLQTIETPLPDWVRARYLALPEDIPERVYDLTDGLTFAENNAYGRAIAVERYLRAFPYSLDLPQPPTDQDIVDYFLFDLQRGYCDYYATAMVVMARASGLPARLAVGYASGEFDPVNNRFVVTAADAHSWVEIYFSGVGWVPFEPTGGRPEFVRSTLQTEGVEESSTPNAPFESVWVRTTRKITWGIVVLLLLSLSGFGVWNLRQNWQLRKLPPDKLVAHLFVHLYPAGARLDVQTMPGATPYEFAKAFSERIVKLSEQQRLFSLSKGEAGLIIREIQSLTEYFVKAMYAPKPITESESWEVLKLWRDLRWRLWRAGLNLRLRGLILKESV